MEELIRSLQLAALLITGWFCGAGLILYFDCVLRVLRCGLSRDPHISDECAWQACWGMACMGGLAYSFARANTLGIVPYGAITGGAAFLVGSFCLIAAVATSLWATIRSHGQRSSLNYPSLGRVWLAVLSLTVVFGVVAVVGAK